MLLDKLIYRRDVPKNHLIDEITDIFQAIVIKIKRKGKQNDHSLNVFLEQDFITIYNLALNATFTKCKGPNFPGIDLKDQSQSIGVQVSSETVPNKIYETFEKYYKNQEKLKEIKKIKFFFLSLEVSHLENVTLEKIQSYLNKPKKLKEINKNLGQPYTQITVDPSLFDPANDILSFNFLSERSNEFDNEKLANILNIIQDVWTLYRISIGDISKILNNQQVTSLNDRLASLSKAESIKKIIDTFSPLKVIPYHILTRLHYVGKRIGSMVKIHTLTTDNQTLFDDILAERSSDNERPLINFLLRNKIQIVQLLRSTLKIYLEITKNTTTTCSICKYNSLELEIPLFFESPTTSITIDNLESAFKKAYFFAEYGKFTEAIEQLKNIWQFTFEAKNYNIARFLAVYNLRRLKNSIYLRTDDNAAINHLPKLLLTEVNQDFSHIFNDTITKEEQDVLDYYYHFKHISNQYLILELINETEKAKEVDANGSYYAKEIYLDWYMITTVALDITSHNFLIFDSKFSDVSQIVFKSFKSVLELSLLKHEKSFRPHLWSTFVKYTILILSESNLKECLLSYSRKSPLLTKEDNLKTIDGILTTYITNIHKNLDFLSKYISTRTDNYFSLMDNINHAFQNICLYLTYIPFDQHSLNQNVSKLLEIGKKPNIIKNQNLDNLIQFINEKQRLLTKENCDKILELYNIYPNLFYGLELYDTNFIDLTNFDYLNSSPETLQDLWIIRKSEINELELKTQFQKSLSENYDFSALRLGVITDLVSFDEFKDKTIDYLKDIVQDTYDFFLNEWIIVYFIEIAYHENLDLSLPEYQELLPKKSKELDYYNWLFNVESYNYDDFVPYWLLKNPYYPFLKKFKTIPQIKEKLVQYLKTNEDAKLSHLYFAHFLDS